MNVIRQSVSPGYEPEAARGFELGDSSLGEPTMNLPVTAGQAPDGWLSPFFVILDSHGSFFLKWQYSKCSKILEEVLSRYLALVPLHCWFLGQT